MFLCGRALSNCRNKSLAIHPTPGVYSWRSWAEIVPAPLLAWVEPGQGEHRCSVQCGASWGCYCALLFLSHITWCDKGSTWWQSQCCVWVVRGKSAISWQVGSVIPEDMAGKWSGSNKRHSQMWGFGVEVVQTKQMVLSCRCSVCGGGRWGVGLRSLKMDTFPSVHMRKW